MSKPTAFPLDESRLPFEIPRDEPYREKIARLGQMITDRIPAKKGILTKDDPEYWGLASIVTDEMADVALKMKVRKPMTLPELVKATGKPAGELEPLLQQMAVVGLLEYNWENPRREKQYILPMFVPGSAEFFNMNKQQIADHPEVTAFFERMTFLPLEHITTMVPPGGAGIGMHVIPVEKAIETENRSADIEHISHWLKKYDGKYAAGPCSCRMSRAAMGEGCGDDPDDWCIGVGDMADYLVETNKGHYVTYDEVMQILQKAEDNGFVHQITNIDGENKIFAICNCNVNVCNALRTSQLFNTPNMSRSAYVARVEPENCVACGRCVEYCPAGAVKLGQKLCTKDGPITYPKQELPDAVKWGPDKWAIDYRDKNRINCYDIGPEGLLLEEYAGYEVVSRQTAPLPASTFHVRLRVTAADGQRHFAIQDRADWHTLWSIPEPRYLTSEGLQCGKRFTGAMVGLYVHGASAVRFTDWVAVWPHPEEKR